MFYYDNLISGIGNFEDRCSEMGRNKEVEGIVFRFDIMRTERFSRKKLLGFVLGVKLWFGGGFDLFLLFYLNF